MKISLILSHNKNPLINFQRKGLNQQKSQIFIGSTFSPKCMKKCMKHENKWKRRGKKVLLTLEDKNPRRNLGKNDKNLAWNLRSIKERERKAFEKFKSDRTREKLKVVKKLSIQFSINRKLDSIDRKSHSIDPTTIETHRAKPKF